MPDTVLFDLDGTLLPMDQEKFVAAYFGLLAQKAAPRGYEREALIRAVWAGTAAMVKNDGAQTNEQVFWADFAGRFSRPVAQDIPLFDEFYRKEFHRARSACGFQPAAGGLIRRLHAAGKKLILASNPIFPRAAQEARLQWAGVDPALFSHFTSYENSHYCKPNPAYYAEIAEVCGLDPANCLMVGNDAEEDGAARAAGFPVYLITDCLINPRSLPLDFPHGSFSEFIDDISALL